MTNVLVTRSEHDLATTYLASYGALLVEQARQWGHSVTDLHADAATNENFGREIELNDLFIGFGHGNCYSDDTEILTENGWKLFPELMKGEKVATLNPQTNELEYHVPTAYIEQNYKGLMFYQHGRSIDLLVTPNHNLWVSHLIHDGKFVPFHFVKPMELKHGLKRDSKGRFASSGSTISDLKYKRDAKWNCEALTTFQLPATETSLGSNQFSSKTSLLPPINLPADAWLRFFGIWLAEGCTNQSCKGHYRIAITQNHDEKRRVIKKWIVPITEKLNRSFYEQTSNEHSKTILVKSKQLYDYLKQFGKAKQKFIPQKLKMLPPAQLKILFEALMFGDGSRSDRHPNSMTYASASKRLADDVQEIAVKLGYAAIVTPQRNLWMVSITTKHVNPLCSKSMRGYTFYQGKIYSVTVKHHIIYVRRNGKACWSGNSDIFTGQDLEVLLKDTVNADVMSGKECYLAACQCGVKLGPAMVEKTCPRFYGFQGDFVFVYHPDYYAEGRILEDPYAKSFFDSVLTTGYAVLLGKSFEEVYNETVDRYKYWWDWWLKQNDPMTDSILTWLNWNRQNFIGINAEPPETRVIGTPKLTIGAVALPLGAAALLLLLSRLEKKGKPI